MYDSDYIISCSNPIPSVENNLKNIYLGGPIWDGFTSKYYNDKNGEFGMLFQQYIASAVNNIYHPYIVIECKDKMDKSDYKKNTIWVFTCLL